MISLVRKTISYLVKDIIYIADFLLDKVYFFTSKNLSENVIVNKQNEVTSIVNNKQPRDSKGRFVKRT